jgi:hypothetical protein
MDSLKLGLRFREPWLIKQALEQLQSNDKRFPSTEEQELVGCEMLMQHISDMAFESLPKNGVRQEDELSLQGSVHYMSILLQIGVDYMSSLIKRHTQELLAAVNAGTLSLPSSLSLLTEAYKSQQPRRRRRKSSLLAASEGVSTEPELVDVILQLSADLDELRHLQGAIISPSSSDHFARRDASRRGGPSTAVVPARKTEKKDRDREVDVLKLVAERRLLTAVQVEEVRVCDHRT